MKLKKVFFTALIFWNWMRSSSKLCCVLLILDRSGRGAGERFAYVSQSEDILILVARPGSAYLA